MRAPAAERADGWNRSFFPGRGHHLSLPGQPRVQPAGLQPPGEQVRAGQGQLFPALQSRCAFLEKAPLWCGVVSPQGPGGDRGVHGLQHLVHQTLLQRSAHRESTARLVSVR